jgi:hypothetical protein
MDRKTTGLLSAVAGLATMGAAQAATPPGSNPSEALQAASYGDLLAPIQNAVALMRADDAARMQESRTEASGNVQLAQGYYYAPPPYYYRHHHHHHHHHHHAYYHHHHHHHHHHSAFVGIPGVGGVVVGRP